jgi:hypothetical protein
MPFEAILREVDHLQNVSTRLEALAERHPLVSEPLMTIAGNVAGGSTLSGKYNAGSSLNVDRNQLGVRHFSSFREVACRTADTVQLPLMRLGIGSSS